MRRLQVPPGAIETVKIFGINKPMQLGGDEAPLPLKANWDGLETRSLSGSQDLYNLTRSSADDGKSWFVQTPCRENLHRRDLRVQPIFVIKAGISYGIPILLFRFYGDRGFSWENLWFCHGLSPAGNSVQCSQPITDIHGRRRS